MESVLIKGGGGMEVKGPKMSLKLVLKSWHLCGCYMAEAHILTLGWLLGAYSLDYRGITGL